MSWWWLVILIIIVCLLIAILCIVCAVVRNRGAKYPVSEKEREQGREPMLAPDEKGFGEYGRGPAGERASLASMPQSETESMAEYGGELDGGRFNEDGSFIGGYGPNAKLVVNAEKKQSPQTFV
jgi:flagellar biosynthesis/type III secretory pathway M-ring protein FliF/YscJ